MMIKVMFFHVLLGAGVSSLWSLLQLNGVQGYSRSSAAWSSRSRMVRLWAAPRFIDLSLGQYFHVDKFLEIYAPDAPGSPPSIPIQGVFAIEDDQQKVLCVQSSTDVYSSLTALLENAAYKPIKSSAKGIRVQSFDQPEQSLLDGYEAELIRQTEPMHQALLDASNHSGDNIVSPFAAIEELQSQVTPIPPTPEEELELTLFNVDKVLDEIRPYLVQDGGNVRVIEVNKETRDIKLFLEGACGSCPSSTVNAINSLDSNDLNNSFFEIITDDYEVRGRAHIKRKLSTSRTDYCSGHHRSHKSFCREGQTPRLFLLPFLLVPPNKLNEKYSFI